MQAPTDLRCRLYSPCPYCRGTVDSIPAVSGLFCHSCGHQWTAQGTALKPERYTPIDMEGLEGNRPMRWKGLYGNGKDMIALGDGAFRTIPHAVHDS